MTQRRLRMLLAEGSPGEAAAALHALYAGNDPGLDLTVVSTVATLLPTIKVVDPEVILLDLALNLREPMDAVHLVDAPRFRFLPSVSPIQTYIWNVHRPARLGPRVILFANFTSDRARSGETTLGNLLTRRLVLGMH